METKSSNTIQNEKVEQDGLLRFVELLDGVNRRLGKDAIVAIPTRDDEKKERQNATASKRDTNNSSPT